jgi:hypothetical protein
MKREKRPFVVEVKRGPKRSQSSAHQLAEPDKSASIRRAEEALFGRAAQTAPAVQHEAAAVSEPASPPRRILEAVQSTVVEFEFPRRGRKPGSKNKQKDEVPEAITKRRRGRPSKRPDSEVRHVAVTPELTSAALREIATTSSPQPAPPGPGGRMHPVPVFDPPAKRKRGRPPKVRPPEFDWTVWSSDDVDVDHHVPVAAPRDPDIGQVPPPVHDPHVSRQRIKAGQRWKRRLRVPTGSGRSRSNAG